MAHVSIVSESINCFLRISKFSLCQCSAFVIISIAVEGKLCRVQSLITCLYFINTFILFQRHTDGNSYSDYSERKEQKLICKLFSTVFLTTMRISFIMMSNSVWIEYQRQTVTFIQPKSSSNVSAQRKETFLMSSSAYNLQLCTCHWNTSV